MMFWCKGWRGYVWVGVFEWVEGVCGLVREACDLYDKSFWFQVVSDDEWWNEIVLRDDWCDADGNKQWEFYECWFFVWSDLEFDCWLENCELKCCEFRR